MEPGDVLVASQRTGAGSSAGIDYDSSVMPVPSF